MRVFVTLEYREMNITTAFVLLKTDDPFPLLSLSISHNVDRLVFISILPMHPVPSSTAPLAENFPNTCRLDRNMPGPINCKPFSTHSAPNIRRNRDLIRVIYKPPLPTCLSLNHCSTVHLMQSPSATATPFLSFSLEFREAKAPLRKKRNRSNGFRLKEI